MTALPTSRGGTIHKNDTWWSNLLLWFWLVFKLIKLYLERARLRRFVRNADKEFAVTRLLVLKLRSERGLLLLKDDDPLRESACGGEAPQEVRNPAHHAPQVTKHLTPSMRGSCRSRKEQR